MSFFTWVIATLVVMAGVFFIEWFIKIWVEWPFEE
jgi:hypothetical protein